MTENLTALVIALLLAVIIILLIKRRDGHAPVITLPFDEDESYNIAGINKYKISNLDRGTWRGFVKCEPNNPYDSNAVAVYLGNNRQVGYLNKEIAESCREDIAAEGGKLPCIVRIEQKFDEEEKRLYYRGRVQILWEDTV